MSLERAAGEAAAVMRIWLDRTEAVRHVLAFQAGKGKGRVTLAPPPSDA